MGRELIPFARRGDAEEFLRDHGGRRIVVLDEIERELPGLAGERLVSKVMFITALSDKPPYSPFVKGGEGVCRDT